MNLRFLRQKDTVNIYLYVSKFMSKEEYLSKLGKVKLIVPENPIKEGLFPDIYLQSTMAEMISIAEIAKDKNVVLFFYPGDIEGLKYPELAGCTPEACGFKDTVDQFDKLNTKIFGISFQTSERQSQFVEAQHLNFSLLSDSEQKLTSVIGLPYWKSTEDELYPCRQTYVIKKGNEISKVFESVEPSRHIEEVLSEIKKIENVLEFN